MEHRQGRRVRVDSPRKDGTVDGRRNGTVCCHFLVWKCHTGYRQVQTSPTGRQIRGYVSFHPRSSEVGIIDADGTRGPIDIQPDLVPSPSVVSSRDLLKVEAKETNGRYTQFFRVVPVLPGPSYTCYQQRRVKVVPVLLRFNCIIGEDEVTAETHCYTDKSDPPSKFPHRLLSQGSRGKPISYLPRTRIIDGDGVGVIVY